MVATTPVRGERTKPPKVERRVEELFQFRCSLRWFGASAGVAAAAGLAVYWGGAPAALALGTAGLAGLTYATMIEPRLPVLERVTLRVPTLPPALDGLRIGQLSDMHLGMPHNATNTRRAVQQIMQEQPDLIVLTGDFVSFEWAIGEIGALFQSLHAPLGVYAITGNHDHWEGVEEIRDQLEPSGIEFLINENRCIHWRGGQLWLAGIDDMWYGTPDLHAALADIPDGAFTVLLAHEPDFADIASLRDIAVQLSGHTHGGHINIPGLGAPCLPYHGINYVSGLYQVGAMQVYVSRGLGGAPLRFNCAPEYTLLTLRCA